MHDRPLTRRPRPRRRTPGRGHPITYAQSPATSGEHYGGQVLPSSPDSYDQPIASEPRRCTSWSTPGSSTTGPAATAVSPTRWPPGWRVAAGRNGTVPAPYGSFPTARGSHSRPGTSCSRARARSPRRDDATRGLCRDDRERTRRRRDCTGRGTANGAGQVLRLTAHASRRSPLRTDDRAVLERGATRRRHGAHASSGTRGHPCAPGPGTRQYPSPERVGADAHLDEMRPFGRSGGPRARPRMHAHRLRRRHAETALRAADRPVLDVDRTAEPDRDAGGPFRKIAPFWKR